MDRGLARSAASRPRTARCLSTDVDADVGRYPPDVEAAVYFCCLEAMQNAGKHAGEGARITITVERAASTSCASRSPTTAPASTRRAARCSGHGFVNMADRRRRDRRFARRSRAQPGRARRCSGRLPLDRSASTTRLSGARLSCARGPRARARAPDRSPPCGRTRSRRRRVRRPGGRPPSTSTAG